ncbi:MAG TPA: TonB family protein [Longimicrobium sp.]|nr:TonB family protein [Longimicrobium sp.]
MANCPQCGGTVSGTAGTCPHCGHPLPGAAEARVPEEDRPGIPAGWLVLGFVLVTALGAGLLGVGVYRLLERVNPPGPHRPQPVVRVDTTPPPAADTTAQPALPGEEPPGDGAGTQPPDTATAQLGEVEVQPEMLDRGQVAAEMARNYPPALRAAGVAGEVTVQFRINAAGGVDASTIQVVHSTDPAFSDPAVRVISRTRWRPARKDGRPVAVWITIPLLFDTLD